MRYDAILLDADDTLFDFGHAERAAMAEILKWSGIDDEGAYPAYREINDRHWKKLERGELTGAQISTSRFEEFFALYGVKADIRAAADRYQKALARQAKLLQHAQAVVERIAEKLPIAVVTNGLAGVQHARFDSSPIRPFIRALVISGEIGFAKPDPRLLYEALRQLGGVDPSRALMVGDSPSSDLRAANAANIDACWYNPAGKTLPEGVSAKYIVDDLRRIPEIAFSADGTNEKGSL